MTKITFEQFERGFTAVRLSFGRRTALSIAAMEAGYEDFEMATDPAVYELQRQLEERCNDPDREGGTMISYALHECLECSPGKGFEAFKVHDAGSLWRWWRETESGPFTPGPKPFAHFQWNGGWDVWEQVVDSASDQDHVVPAFSDHPEVARRAPDQAAAEARRNEVRLVVDNDEAP